MFTKEGKKIGKPVKDSIRSKTKKGRTNSEYSNTQSGGIVCKRKS